MKQYLNVFSSSLAPAVKPLLSTGGRCDPLFQAPKGTLKVKFCKSLLPLKDKGFAFEAYYFPALRPIWTISLGINLFQKWVEKLFCLQRGWLLLLVCTWQSLMSLAGLGWAVQREGIWNTDQKRLTLDLNKTQSNTGWRKRDASCPQAEISLPCSNYSWLISDKWGEEGTW